MIAISIVEEVQTEKLPMKNPLEDGYVSLGEVQSHCNGDTGLYGDGRRYEWQVTPTIEKIRR